MTPRRRELFFKVVDDDQRALPILHHANRLTRCDDILTWLVENNLTGRRFVDFFLLNEASILKTYQEVLKRINKDKIIQPIFAGRDYIV